MKKLRRFTYASLLPMTFLLPCWLVAGRGLFGSSGWLTLAMFFMISPLVMIGMGIISFCILRRKDARKTGMASKIDAVLLTAFYASTFLYGFFLVDYGDTDDSIVSVASNLFGKGFIGASEVLGVVFFYISAALLIAAGVVALAEADQQDGKK